MKNHLEVGAEGEILALQYLQGNGYCLRHSNYKYKHGEIDLVMDAPDGIIVFIEVKTSKSRAAGPPESWVTRKKILQIQKTAQVYCHHFGLTDEDMRFDVVSVVISGSNHRIRHIPNAFLPDRGASSGI